MQADAVTPVTGPVVGGTRITITGTNLDRVDRVKIGSSIARHLRVINSHELTVRTPRGHGKRRIKLVIPGRRHAFRIGWYSYSPTVTSISPATGSVDGGTLATIKGAGLGRTTEVLFGGASGQIVGRTATSVRVRSPKHSAGAVSVNVIASHVRSPANADVSFLFASDAAPVIPDPPTVDSVSPHNGSASGGTTVTITGTNLSDPSSVAFGATDAPNFTVDSSTQITVTSPAHSDGDTAVYVTTLGGTSPYACNAQFTYELIASLGGPRGGSHIQC